MRMSKYTPVRNGVLLLCIIASTYVVYDLGLSLVDYFEQGLPLSRIIPRILGTVGWVLIVIKLAKAWWSNRKKQ